MLYFSVYVQQRLGKIFLSIMTFHREIMVKFSVELPLNNLVPNQAQQGELEPRPGAAMRDKIDDIFQVEGIEALAMEVKLVFVREILYLETELTSTVGLVWEISYKSLPQSITEEFQKGNPTAIKLNLIGVRVISQKMTGWRKLLKL
ncbi:hypothetical protein CFP56_026110 [Quercus suber]|uniref:Uncharacterized protein n=1 Tax=Quercus suber TaxID=58331 RepID=A0AAW0K1Z1_QUESU